MWQKIIEYFAVPQNAYFVMMVVFSIVATISICWVIRMKGKMKENEAMYVERYVRRLGLLKLLQKEIFAEISIPEDKKQKLIDKYSAKISPEEYYSYLPERFQIDSDVYQWMVSLLLGKNNSDEK